MSDKQGERERRRHRSRAEADHLAAEYEGSGLSCKEFCNQNDLGIKSLARYVARYRKQNGGKAQRWVAVEVAAKAADGSELMVHLSSGRRIEVKRGFDVHTLRQLVSVLDRV
jgi:transposase